MATGKWYRAVYFNNLTEGAEGERKKERAPDRAGAAEKQNASGEAGGVLMRLGNEQANVTAWQQEAEKLPASAQRALLE
jgi:hypothetical protein